MITDDVSIEPILGINYYKEINYENYRKFVSKIFTWDSWRIRYWKNNSNEFICSLVEKYGKHAVYTDGGTWYDETWNVLKLEHHLHSSIEKSLMERVNQYFKDRIESFDDYYLCVKNDCNLFHVYNWIQFFVSMYNETINKDEVIVNLQEEANKILN